MVVKISVFEMRIDLSVPGIADHFLSCDFQRSPKPPLPLPSVETRDQANHTLVDAPRRARVDSAVGGTAMLRLFDYKL